MAESILVQFNTQVFSQLFNRFRYLHANRKHHQVEFLFDSSGMLFEGSCVANFEIVCSGVFFHLTEPAAGVFHPVLIFCPLVILFITLAVCPRVHEEHLA